MAAGGATDAGHSLLRGYNRPVGILIHQVDAFTDRPFTGNPAAVCLLPREADPGWMQAVAAEMNLAETAFVWPIGGPPLPR
jgi:predicted PhzF superfamily epimerase YddE/YHI9